VMPLKKALQGNRIWITGLRAEQSENRNDLQAFEFDEKFDIIKYNPLLKWSLEEVENYLEKNKVPQNILHKKGFVSIGCAPCTRAIAAGEDIRAGRWWWETSQKECGLHQK
jgi:phosphoadenosine phosphosulfate reductase